MTVDLDSTVCQVHGYHKQGAAYGYTHELGYHRCWPPAPTPAGCCTPASGPGRHRPRRRQIRYSITVRQTKPIRQAIAAIDEEAWTPIAYPDGGVAQVAETRHRTGNWRYPACPDASPTGGRGRDGSSAGGRVQGARLGYLMG